MKVERPILTVEDVVVRGEGVAGPVYDLPTANLEFKEPLSLDHGVYAAHTEYGGRKYESVAVYGVGEPPKFEVHLFEFDKDLVGEVIKVHLLKKVSELIPWASKERMRQKIYHDVELVQAYFK